MQNTYPLDSLRKYFGYNMFHFWQLADQSITPIDPNCPTLVHEYAFQSGADDNVGRSEIRTAIASAEADFATLMRFNPMPKFMTRTINVPRYYDQTQRNMSYSGSDDRWLTLRMPEGKIQKVGVEAFSAYDTDLAPVYTDEDGDSLIDTFTLTLAGLTLPDDLNEIEVYFNDRAGDDYGEAWKIVPIKILVTDENAGNITITGRAWCCVPPQDYEGVQTGAVGDPSTSAPFTTSMDVVRHYCNPTGTTVATAQAMLIWETTPYPFFALPCINCGIPQLSNSTDPAALAYAIARVGIRNSDQGILYFGEALYDSSNGVWYQQNFMSNCRPPDRIEVRYLAGDALDNGGHVQKQWARVIAPLAAARFGKRICGCAPAAQMIYDQQVDRAFNADSKVDQFNLSQDDLGNPLGTQNGAIAAWKIIKRERQYGGIRA